MSQLPNEVEVTPFTIEIPPETYQARGRYAADDAIQGRRGHGHHGVIAGLRTAIENANGKTVVLTIETR